MQDHKPATHQGDLTKLPRALAPLVERPQFALWRWTLQGNGRWQKPPFMATAPERHASTKDPSTWTDYLTALAAVQAGHADGISYVLTDSDPFAAIDLDDCRNPDTGSIGVWAQNFLDEARHTYSEVTPSGTGCRIWGLTGGNTAPVHRKFSLEIDGKQVAAELFRRTPKALTITGYRLDSIRELTNIDPVIDWAIVWGERRKAAAAEAAATQQINSQVFNCGGGGHEIEHIEQIVREGAGGANRSNEFHKVIGHYLGCGLSVEQIDEHLRQFPEGIASRYLREGRLSREIARSASKYNGRVLPLLDGWKAPEKIVEMRETPSRETDPPEPTSPATPDPGDDGVDDPPKPVLPETPDPDEDLDDDPDELDEPKPVSPKPETPDPGDDPEPEDDDPELEDDEPGESQADPKLPPLYAHGDADPRPLKPWLIKHLMPTVGHGLLSGQWGTYKTFVVFDLAGALMTGQPFLGHPVKRQCGVLLIAAEGASEVRSRLDAVVRNKCGNMERAPFRWYETTPLLLQKGAAETLIAMARQADASLQQEFGLPLGLVVIDTIAACAGYTKAGDENDSAAGQAIMSVLKAIARELGCFVLGVHHFGKNKEAGTRGTGATEDASDVVWACLGERSITGSVSNTRLAVRKNKGGLQGEEHPFTPRVVEAPEPDEDGDPITTLVVDWVPASASGGPRPAPDPWDGGTPSQRASAQRLKRVLMGALAEHGVEREIPPDGPVVRMIKQKIVRELFYGCTPVGDEDDGDTPDQKTDAQRKQFDRARDRAEARGLIACHKIEGVVHLRLCGFEHANE